MTADRPMTRRELRERERAAARAAGESTEHAGPEERRPVRQDPHPTRRALREAAREQETTLERSAVRRRPVRAPSTTGLSVVDQATGAVTAVPLTAEPEPGAGAVAESAPEREPEPAPEREREPAPEREPEPAPETGTVPGPEVAAGADRPPEVALQRRSVMARRENAIPTAPAPVGDAGEPAEEADVRVRAGRSALATILRLLVILVAAFVVGALIWLVADGAVEPAAEAVARGEFT